MEFGDFLGYFAHNSYCLGLFLPGNQNELCKIWVRLGLCLLPSLGRCSRRCHPRAQVPLSPRCCGAEQALMETTKERSISDRSAIDQRCR